MLRLALLVLLVSACSPVTGETADQSRTWIGQPVWSLVKRYSLVRTEASYDDAGAQKTSYKMAQPRGLCDVSVKSRPVDGDYMISDMSTTCPAGALSQR